METEQNDNDNEREFIQRVVINKNRTEPNCQTVRTEQNPNL